MGARSVRLPLAVLLLLAVAVLFVSEGAEALDPEWSYSTNYSVQSVAVSADGEYIAAGTWNDYVYLFAKASSTPLWGYETDGNMEKNSIDISANGDYIVAYSSGSVILFGKSSSTPIWEYEDGENFKAVSISADGEHITAMDNGEKLFLFGKSSSTPLWSHYLSDGDDSFEWIAQSESGDYIVASTAHYDDDDGWEYGLNLYGKDSSTPLWSYSVDEYKTRTLAISADGNYFVLSTMVASSPYDNKAFLFSKDSSTPLWSYSISADSSEPPFMNDISLSADGKYIAMCSGNADDRVYLFDRSSSTPLWNYSSSGNNFLTVAISADGKYIVAGDGPDDDDDDPRVYFFSKSNSTLLWNYTAEDGGQINDVSISADGKIISAGENEDYVYTFKNNLSASPFVFAYSPIGGDEIARPVTLGWFAGSDDHSNLTFDVYLGTNSSSLTKVADDITTLNYSPGNLAMGTKYYWKVVATDSSGSITSSVMNFTVAVAPEWSYETGDDVYSVAISVDGEYIAAGSWDAKVYFFDKDSSTPLWSYETGDVVYSVAISADGEYIAAGSWDAKVYLFDKDSSTPLWSYTTGNDVSAVAISADGEYIAAGSLDGKVYLFDKGSNTPLWSYETGHNVKFIDISAEGEYITVGSYNKLYLFDKDSGTPLWNYSWSSGGPDSVDISADGEYITAGSYDNKAYLFDKDSSTPLWSYDTGEDVFSVSISMDGEYIAAASRDKKVYLFGKDSGTPLWSYPTGGDVWSVSISADGEYITAGSYDNNAYLFDKDSSTPLWSYTTGGDVWSVTISADGKYIAAGSFDNNVYAFKNSLADRPSLFAYGPRSGSNTDTDPQLGWFAGSDDRSNLTFDVYLDNNSDPTTKVADDITAFHYNTQCLDLNTKYYWKVIATDGTGSVNSSIMNFTVTTPGSIFCISIDDGEYDPDDLTITVGDMVIWTNNDDSLHTVTSDDDEFDSGTLGSGNSWSYTFNATGMYDYQCEYHGSMTGTIEVVVSYKPTATIDSISPQIAELYNSTSFSGHGNDTDGTITVYQWTSSIDGELSTEASFSTNLTFGNHTITFSVKDNDGVWSDEETSWVDVRKSAEWSYVTGEADVKTVAISADGEYIVAGSDNDRVYFFEKDNGTPLWSSQLSGNTNSVAISERGEYLVAGAGSVYLFAGDNSTYLWKYDTESSVTSVAISAGGKYIVAGCYDYNLYLFDKDSSTPLWSHSLNNTVYFVAISADGEYIVAGGADDKVYLFDKDSSTPLWNYHTGNTVEWVAISADGEYITAGSGSNVYLFDKDSGTLLWSYDSTTSNIWSVDISADGEYIVAGSGTGNSGTIYFFGKDNSTPLWTYNISEYVDSVAISANGEHIVAGSRNNKIYQFYKNSNTPLWSYTAEDDVWTVAISADGKYAVSGSDDSKVYAFRNDPVSRPSVIPYGPRSGSDVLNATTLRWFPGSDDIANLTFDVYLSWIKTDVEDNNSAARVADDISNYTFSVSGLTEDKTYYWKVVATDPTGSATSRIMEFYVLDTTAPITHITSGPPDPTKYINATFTFTANENDVTFECKVDTGNWSNCTSPVSYYNLSRGDYHLFQVKATDDSGNEGEEDDWMWEILENDKPTASIDSISPQIADLDEEVTFSGSGEDDDGTIVAYLWTSSLFNGTLSTSANFTVTDLPFGNHTITFMVKDNEGDWSDEVTSWVDVRKMPEWSYETGEVDDLAVSANGEYILVGTNTNKIYLFSKDNSTPLWSSSLAGAAKSVSISADGNYFVVGSWDEEMIYLFSRNSSTPEWSYEPEDNVNSVSISADGEYMAVGCDGGPETAKLYLFSKDSNTPIWTYSPGAAVTSVSISADGEYIAAGTGGSNPHVYLFAKDSSTPQWNSTVYGLASSIDISSDGDYIAVGTRGEYNQDDGVVYLFHKDSGSPLWNYDAGGEVYWLSITADGEWIAVTSYQAKTFFLFNKDSNTPFWNYTTQEYPSDITISADGKYVVAGSFSGAYFFESSSGSPLWTYSTDGKHVSSVSISADGKYIGVGTDDLDDTLYLLKNSQSSRPSVIPYGPRSGSEALSNTTLRWFPGSDDIANLTFDVYLDTSSNASTRIANDITDYHYTVSDLSEDVTYYWKIVATDNTGTATSQVMHFTVADTTPPIATITSGPDNVTSATTATFYSTSNEDNSTFECAIDGGGWSNCTSNSTYYSGLGLGGHTFAVKATDPSDNTGEPAYWNWTIRSQYVVYIEDGEYNSSYIEIEQGYAVTWVNNDDTLHTVTSNESLFDSGGLGPGDEWSYYFDDAGTYDYHCEYHGSMSGTVVVEEQNASGNEPPTVWNVTTSPNPAYENEWVYFSAEWNDTDGYVVAFEWWSDHDGLLSESGNFSSDTLSVADHNIIFRVQDNDGAWSENETVGLAILSENASNDPPEVWNISISPNPAYENEWVYFSAEWNDTDGYVVAFEWWSDVDGLLSTNGSFDSVWLSVGNHTISFRVQDDDGEWSGNASVGLDILEQEEESELPWSYETGSSVVSSAISADGEYIVAGSGDKVYLFDKDSNIPLWSYETGSFVLWVDISADGEYIVAGSLDYKVYLFDKDSSTPLWSYETGGGISYYSVAISADGGRIAVGSSDNKIYLFDKNSSTPLWSYETGNYVWSVAISADGRYIAAGSYDSKVYLFSWESSTPLWTYSTGYGVRSVSISADGEYITAGSFDNKVYLFDKDSSIPLWSYETGDYIWGVAISADGTHIAAASYDYNVYFFHRDSNGTPIWNYATGAPEVPAVDISADGAYIVASSYDRKIYLFDIDSSTPIMTNLTGGYGFGVSISSDGQYFAAGSDDNNVYVFKNTESITQPTVSDIFISPNPADSSERVYFSADYSDSDGNVIAFEWSSDINGILSTSSSFDSDNLSIGHHNISFRVQDNDGAWSEYAFADLTIEWEPAPDYPAGHWFMLPDMTLSNDVDRLSNSSSIKYVAAKYDQYPDLRTNKELVLVGEWELGESPVELEITFEDAQIWFIGLDNDYEAECKWEFKVLVDGAIARKTMRTCASNGDYLAMESYNLSLSFSAGAGQEISIEVWYEGWEDINFYYGSLTHGSGFNISGFQSEAVNQVPVATLLVSPNPAGLGETVYFTGKGYDPDGQVVAFEWKINDETVSSERSFTRNDLPAGSHTVSFRVMDNSPEWSDWVTDELTIEEGYTPWLLARITPLFDYDKFFIQVFSENDLESVTVEVDDGISSTDGAAFIKKQDDHTFDGFYNFTGADTYVITATGIGLDGTRSSVSIVVPIKEVTTTAGEPLRVVHEAVGTSVTLVTNTGVTGQVSISVSTIKPDLPEDSGLIDTGLYFLIKIDIAILAELDYANVTIDYDPDKLPGGLLEETLDIYHYDSFNQTWEPTNFGGINFEENYVWGHFSNFSVFAVFGSNAAPVADAGPDLQVTPGSQAMFLGSAVDADGYITLYEWDFDGDGVFDYSSSDGIASHVFDEEGSYLVTLRVTDNEGSTGFDETVVTVGESSSFAFFDSLLFRIFFPTVILLLAVGYYTYRKYGTLGAGALGAEKSKFALKKEEDVTVVCPACGIDMKVPRLGTLQLVICDNCGNEGEMEV